jgi:hypothetical protein
MQVASFSLATTKQVKGEKKIMKLNKKKIQMKLVSSDPSGWIATKQPSTYAYIVEEGRGKNQGWFAFTYKSHGARNAMIKEFVDQLQPQIQIQLQKIKAAAAKRAAA